jgi:hypothetical protein
MPASPTQLIIVVEGQTEDNFVSRILAPHLGCFGISTSSTIVGKVKAKARGLSGSGVRGGFRFADWKKDIRNCLTTNSKRQRRVTTLCDLYGLPDDFPGLAFEAGDRNTDDRCARLEREMSSAIGGAEEVGIWRFMPYIQRYEFEALVLAAADSLKTVFNAEDQLAGLSALQSEIAGLPPEEINDSPMTAPSKRLLSRIPGYRKPLHGPDAIEEAGLSVVRSQCPRFDQWLSSLERLGCDPSL